MLDEAAQAAQLEGVRVLRGRGGGSDDPMQGLGEPVREAARLAGETATPLLPELVKLSAALARETGVTGSTIQPALDGQAVLRWSGLTLLVASVLIFALDRRRASKVAAPASGD